uniref:GCR027 n=1 Tax=Schmidtea mediterranea TaxID=79327 RepID=A0A193KU74_SCHMD|nr:GCR027 [Schmidtea mediterranea]
MDNGTFPIFNMSFHSRYNWAYVGLFIIPMLSMWGNSLVCISVWVEVGLRKRFNYFLVSLAMSDFLCAILVMPISAWKMIDNYYLETINHQWCLIWYSLDVFFTASTIIHLCTISIDRYNALKNPLKIHGQKRYRSLVVQLVCAWIIPFSIACPLFLFALELDKTREHSSFKGCGPQNAYFILIATIVTFFIPLIIMTVTYVLTVKILYVQRKEAEANLYSNAVASLVFKPKLSSSLAKFTRTPSTKVMSEKKLNGKNENSSAMHRRSISTSCLVNSLDSEFKETENHNHFEMTPLLAKTTRNNFVENTSMNLCGSDNLKPPLQEDQYKQTLPQRQVSFREQQKTKNHYWKSNTVCTVLENPLALLSHQRSFKMSNKTKTDEYSAFYTKKKETEKQLKQINRSRKAVQTLGILFLLFVICYLPFFVAYLVDFFFKICSVSSTAEKMLTFLEWMGYSGSMFNPIVYHFFNPIFRHTYQRLMKCQCYRVFIRHASSSQR